MLCRKERIREREGVMNGGKERMKRAERLSRKAKNENEKEEDGRE